MTPIPENALPNYDKRTIEDPSAFFRTLFHLRDIKEERAIPAVVKDYDAKTGEVTVLPMAKYTFDTRDGEAEVDRESVKVRALKICQGGYSISLPIFKGDTGWLIAGDRRCGAAIEKNGEIVVRDLTDEELKDKTAKPDDCSILNFENGFFIPFSWSMESIGEEKSLIIRNVSKDEELNLKNNHGVYGTYPWSMIEIQRDGTVNAYGGGTKFSIGKGGLYLNDKLTFTHGNGLNTIIGNTKDSIPIAGDVEIVGVDGNTEESEIVSSDIHKEEEGEIVAETKLIEKGGHGKVDKSRLKLDLKLKRKKIILNDRNDNIVGSIEYYASNDLPIKPNTGLDITSAIEKLEDGDEQTVFYLNSLLEAGIGIEITKNKNTNAWKIKNTGVIGLVGGNHISISKTQDDGVLKIDADNYPEVFDGTLTVKYGNDSEGEEDSDAKGFSNSDFTANTESDVTLKIPKPIRKKASKGDGTFGLDISHNASRNVVEFENTGLTGLSVQQSGQNRYAQITGGTDAKHDEVDVKTKDITLTLPIPQSIEDTNTDEKNLLDAIAAKITPKGSVQTLDAEETIYLYLDKSKANTSIKTHDGSELGKVFGDGNDIKLPQTPTIPDIEVDATAITSGKAVGGMTVDAVNKHKIIVSAVDIPAAANDGKLYVKYSDYSGSIKIFSANQGERSTLSLHKVARTGNYEDLSNKPDALKNPKSLTIKKSGSEDIVYDGSEEKEITLEGGAPLDHSFSWEGVKKADIAASADIAVDSKTIQGSGGITVSEKNRVITINGSGSQVAGYTTPSGTYDYEVTGIEWNSTKHQILIHKVKKTYENGLLKTRESVTDEYIQFVEETA